MRQLETILASETFKNSNRLGRFLRYVVEQTLNGHAVLKERDLGVDVFDRPIGYDTRADPVVRVEARQLRFKLAEYYAHFGMADDVLISLPKGGYTALFKREAPPPASDPEPALLPEQPQLRAARRAWTPLLAALAGTILLALAYRVIEGHPTARTSGFNSHVASPEARNLYLEGRYYWNKRTPDGLNRAVDYFTQAIVRDPNYSQAYVGLADSYNLLSEYSSMYPRDGFERAIQAAKRAVELDDTSAEAHSALAYGSFWGNWDIATARREFERALALNPNYVPAHHWYATYLLVLGRFSDSLSEIERARELDPLSTPILADKGLILFYAGRQQEAVTLLTQLEAAEPRFLSSHRYLSTIYFIGGNYRAYISEMRQTALLSHDAEGLAISDAATKGITASGERSMLENTLRTQMKFYAQGRVPAYSLAQTCALLGEKQAAFDYLRHGLDHRESSMLALRIDLRLRSLHGDPDYQDLLRKVGLPPLN